MSSLGIRKWGFIFKDKNPIEYFKNFKVLSNKKDDIKKFNEKEIIKGTKVDKYVGI